MGLLNKIIGDSLDQFKTNTKGVGTRVGSSAKNAVGNAVNQTTRGISNAGTGVVNAGIKGVTGAATKAMNGDFSGALQEITNVPNQVLGALGINGNQGLSMPGTQSRAQFSQSSVLGGDGLRGALSRSDPMFSFNWYCELPILFPKQGRAASLPWYFVEEATVPFRNFNIQSSYRDGRQKHYAKDFSVDNLRLSFYLDEAGETINYLSTWQSLIMAPYSIQNYATRTGAFGLPVDYQKPVRLYFIDVNKQTLGVIEYIECWPPSIEALNLQSGTSDRLIASVNFSVGDVFLSYYSMSDSLLNTILNSAENAIVPLISSAFSDVKSAIGNSVSNIFK